MIRRGTPASRLAALGVVLGPVVVALAAFIIWAVSAWIDAGRRISDAQTALHRIEALRSQAELYGPLGESWADYAASSPSGLMLEPDQLSAARALTQQIEALFDRAPGGDGAAAVIGAESAAEGLEVIRAEATGRMPEPALPGFFEALDRHEPFLFVDFLDLRKESPAGAGEPLMAVRIRVSAYRLTGDVR